MRWHALPNNLLETMAPALRNQIPRGGMRGVRLHRRKRAPKSAIPRFTDYSIACIIRLSAQLLYYENKKALPLH